MFATCMPDEKTSPYQYEFEIRSQNPNIHPTQPMVAGIEESVPELADELNRSMARWMFAYASGKRFHSIPSPSPSPY